MSRLFAAALLTAGLLGGVLAWEVQDFSGPEPGPAVRPRAAAPAARAAAAGEPGGIAQEWVATALERPLFREDRRPPKGADAVVARGNEPLRLTGIITGPFGKRAIFLSSDSPKPIIVQENAEVSGFIVRTIEPGKAVVVEPDGTVRTMRPAFAPGGK
jgi:hypothetical protein